MRLFCSDSKSFTWFELCYFLQTVFNVISLRTNSHSEFRLLRVYSPNSHIRFWCCSWRFWLIWARTRSFNFFEHAIKNILESTQKYFMAFPKSSGNITVNLGSFKHTLDSVQSWSSRVFVDKVGFGPEAHWSWSLTQLVRHIIELIRWWTTLNNMYEPGEMNLSLLQKENAAFVGDVFCMCSTYLVDTFFGIWEDNKINLLFKEILQIFDIFICSIENVFL